MSKAYVFPGQGSQFSGMGKDLYEQNNKAKEIFDQSNDILGFDICNIMFNGTEEDLKQTKVTQPAVFIHSMALFLSQMPKPDMVAGHSLGELSALVAAGVLSFEDALVLVSKRAMAMQKACEMNPSTMAAVLGMEDAVVEDICKNISPEIVVAANYNSPGQLVISGSFKGIDEAAEKLEAAGCRRVVKLSVGGAFHSPLMKPAEEELAEAINATKFENARCPVYQNVVAKKVLKADEIKANLVAQLSAPVRWTQSVQQMIEDGADEFIEVGPGKVLQALVKKIDRNITAVSL